MNKMAFFRYFSVFCLFCGLICPAFALAAPAESIDIGEAVISEGTDVSPIKAAITSEDRVQTGHNIIFDASRSQHLNPQKQGLLNYNWELSNGDKLAGKEITYLFSKPGLYQINLTVSDGENEGTATKEVLVFDRMLLLFTDMDNKKDSLAALQNYANQQGIFLNTITNFDNPSDYIATERLAKKIIESYVDVRQGDLIWLWTKNSGSLNALLRFANNFPSVEFQDKTIILTSNENLRAATISAKNTFATIKPKQIILTRSETLYDIIDAKSPEQMMDNLKQESKEFRLVNKKTERFMGWNALSYAINFMIHQGVPTNTLMLILMLPIIATIIAFVRQVIGIPTFGIYIPSIITICFIVLGISYGLAFLFSILILSYFARQIFRRRRMLYIPRMALVLSITSIAILLLFFLGAYLNISGIASAAIFPVLILIILTEKFSALSLESDFLSALSVSGGTILISIFCYFIVGQWGAFQSLILTTPELVLLTLVINYFLGHWTGLRLSEYWRFKPLLYEKREEEEE